MAKQLVVEDDVHETLKNEAKRRGVLLARLVDEVVRSGLAVKRIQVSDTVTGGSDR